MTTAHLRWWMPVAALADAPPTEPGPWPLRLFGEEIALWRGPGGAPVALLDRCPHRGAKLSLGRVCGAELECPYHGWRFDTMGRAVAVPALPGFVPPAGHAAIRYPVREAHGLLWSCLAPDGADAERSSGHREPPALDDLPVRRVLCGPFDVATSAPRVVENFLDTAHFAFVHQGWLGSAEVPDVPHYDVNVDEAGRPGVRGYRAWQPRAQSTAREGSWVRYDYRVLGPYSACLVKAPEAEGAAAEGYVLWACPVDEEHTRVWFTIATQDTGIAESALIQFQETIFAQDRPVLESQRPKRLPLGADAERHVASDRLSVAYRKWLVGEGVGFGVVRS